MNELALFAGAGGGLLATKWLLGWRTICYVENNPYRVKVLKARIRDELLDDAPIWDDARTFNGRPWRGCVDIVTAGFPCQPYSSAGKLQGEHDERNLWPDTIRIIREVEPEWVLLENVPRLLCFPYFGQILGDLAEGGYDTKWDCVPAAALGAPHRRDRLWILSHTAETRYSGQGEGKSERQYTEMGRRQQSGSNGGNGKMAHTNYNKPHKQKSKIWETNQGVVKGRPQLWARGFDWWTVEPDVGRVAHGVAHRVDRLKALGDGQVPAVVKVVWRRLT